MISYNFAGPDGEPNAELARELGEALEWVDSDFLSDYNITNLIKILEKNLDNDEINSIKSIFEELVTNLKTNLGNYHVETSLVSLNQKLSSLQYKLYQNYDDLVLSFFDTAIKNRLTKYRRMNFIKNELLPLVKANLEKSRLHIFGIDKFGDDLDLEFDLLNAILSKTKEFFFGLENNSQELVGLLDSKIGVYDQLRDIANEASFSVIRDFNIKKLFATYFEIYPEDAFDPEVFGLMAKNFSDLIKGLIELNNLFPDQFKINTTTWSEIIKYFEKFNRALKVILSELNQENATTDKYAKYQVHIVMLEESLSKIADYTLISDVKAVFDLMKYLFSKYAS